MNNFQKIWNLYFSGISAKQWRIHLLLFMATFITTTITGMEMALTREPMGAFWQGLGYSFSIMIILTAHEMGHYVISRKYGVDVSLPYFIPVPFFQGFGTLGAFIKMRSLPPGRHELFDIAFWGPAMSFWLSIPISIIGILLSEVHPIPDQHPGVFITYGDSLIFYLFTHWIWDIPAGYDIFIHPVAFAGWAGFFVTAVNLFPISQLDGGHIAYSVLGHRQKELATFFIIVLLLLSLKYTGWLFWIVVLFIMGLKHPPMEYHWYNPQPLDNKRFRLAIISLFIFVITFIPFPMDINYSENPSPVAPEKEIIPESLPGQEFIQHNEGNPTLPDVKSAKNRL